MAYYNEPDKILPFGPIDIYSDCNIRKICKAIKSDYHGFNFKGSDSFIGNSSFEYFSVKDIEVFKIY